MNLGEMAASMTKPLGVSYTEVMEMELGEALCANLDALAVQRKREEAMDNL